MSSEEVEEARGGEAPTVSVQTAEQPKSSRRIQNDQKWDSLKEEIYRLYMSEENTLQNTMRAVLEQHGFKAR